NYGVPVEDFSRDTKNNVEKYWSEHTVNSIPFKSKEESLKYLEWRSEQYPFFHELMGLWGNHAGKVILDYGCGPGNDTVGFLQYSHAQQIIGMDVSPTALSLASHRLSFHDDADLSRVRLIRVQERKPNIPLADESVDFIYSQG
ncbi:class I SAM-dependent methyltransferase, partial [Klebsiella pneumoniae]|uniref:class I SAM-dependent methyltransferase n=1 Tax=Klebsiella pneumoniae TaxID=573 RepID=UPI001E44E42B